MAKRKKKHEKLEGFTDWTAQDGEILTWRYLLKMAEKASDVDSPMMIRLPVPIAFGKFPDGSLRTATSVGLVKELDGFTHPVFFHCDDKGTAIAIRMEDIEEEEVERDFKRGNFT